MFPGPEGWRADRVEGNSPNNLHFRWSPKHQDVEVISKNSLPVYLYAPGEISPPAAECGCFSWLPALHRIHLLHIYRLFYFYSLFFFHSPFLSRFSFSTHVPAFLSPSSPIPPPGLTSPYILSFSSLPGEPDAELWSELVLFAASGPRSSTPVCPRCDPGGGRSTSVHLAR